MLASLSDKLFMEKSPTILLLANYSLDQQYSMLQFADLLTEAIEKAGLPYVLLRPKAYLGNFGGGLPWLKKYLAYIDKYLIFPYLLRRFLRAWRREDLLVHILDHSNALYYPFCKGFSTLMSCHDLIAIKAAINPSKAHTTRFLGRLLQGRILACLKRIPTIICLSKATQKALMKVSNKAKEDLPIVYLSSHYPYRPMDRAQAEGLISSVLGPALLGAKYCLHVGNDAWYKNREGLLYIYKALKDALGAQTPRLVFVGPKLNAAEEALARKYQLEVLQFQNLKEEAINALYAAAQCLILPSLEEGLGLPILEAMAVGCPVVCTHMEPFTEIGGDVAVYIPPLEDFTSQGKEAWAKASILPILSMLQETSAEREKRRQTGFQQAAYFSKQRAVDGYLNIYEKAFAAYSSK